MESFSPKSEKMHISLWSAPNATYAILVVPDVGLEMVAEN